MSDAGGKTVSLVLGSGGARGLTHIGVIQWLEEQGYDIRSIAGSSMGAVVGGIYAAGKLDEYKEWVCAIDKMDIVSLLDLAWAKTGLVKGEKIMDVLRDLVGERDIEDLPIRYTAVATDILREREVWLQKGSLFDAMRASMSLPLIFTPFDYNGTKLIDGGVLNPVPIAPTFSDTNDVTIAVNLGGQVEPGYRRVRRKKETNDDVSELRKKIRNYIDRLQESMTSDETDWDAYDIANQAFDAMQGAVSRAKLAAYPPDKVVTIPRNACMTFEFDRAREMIDLGYRLAGRQLGGDAS